ncbi:hypothetical protein ScPMuIL_004860 [Solemya velum]
MRSRQRINQKQMIEKRHGDHPQPETHGNEDAKWTEEEVEQARNEFKRHHVSCDDDLSKFKEETFLIDRYTMENPIKIMESLPLKYNYTFKLLQWEKGVNMCIVMELDARSTGAVGDVDGDGTLDYIDISSYTGEQVNEHYGFTGNTFSVYVTKTNMESLIKDAPHVSLTNFTASFSPSKEKSPIPLRDVGFEEMKKQPWTQYLGKHIHSHYDDTEH